MPRAWSGLPGCGEFSLNLLELSFFTLLRGSRRLSRRLETIFSSCPPYLPSFFFDISFVRNASKIAVLSPVFLLCLCSSTFFSTGPLDDDKLALPALWEGSPALPSGTDRDLPRFLATSLLFTCCYWLLRPFIINCSVYLVKNSLEFI